MQGIFNHVQITDRIGTSGQPTREQFEELASAGYSTVINLAMPDSTRAIADEDAIVSSLGMTYIHFPVPFDNPTAAALGKFTRLMDAVENEKVWVHCAMNLRVSAFMYQYLRLGKGLNDREALNPLLDKWRSGGMDENWQHFIELGPEDVT